MFLVVVVRSLLHSKLKCLKHLQTSFGLNPCYLDQISSCLFSCFTLSLVVHKFAFSRHHLNLKHIYSRGQLSASLFQISYNCILLCCCSFQDLFPVCILKPALLPMSCLFADVWICLLGLTVRLSCSPFILPAEPCCWILIPVSSYSSSTGSNMNSRPTSLSFSINEVTALTYALEQLCTVCQNSSSEEQSMVLLSSKPWLVKLTYGLSEMLPASAESCSHVCLYSTLLSVVLALEFFQF